MNNEKLIEMNNEDMAYLPEILQFDNRYLIDQNDNKKTLKELGITDDAVLKVGYVVRFTAINKNEFYYVQYNKDTTLKQFLWSVIEHLKLNKNKCQYVSLICKGQFLSPKLLNSKLIDIKVDELIFQETLSENINGSTVTLALLYNTKDQSSYFNLDSLTENDIDISEINRKSSKILFIYI